MQYVQNKLNWQINKRKNTDESIQEGKGHCVEEDNN